MRYITFLTLFILINFSCRTVRHRFEDRYRGQSVTGSTAQYWNGFLQRDSSKRYWSVLTDSLLYFHPDSGLWAYGGRFYGGEQVGSMKERQIVISHKDSVAYSQDYGRKSKRAISSNSISWYVSVFIVGLCVWLWYRR